jgi:tRNA(fMet)-specific endonuclease VapC
VRPTAARHERPRRSVESQLDDFRGWFARHRHANDPLGLVVPYGRPTQLFSFFSEWEIARWTENSARILSRLRKERIRIGTQDLQIASIALAENALLLSASLRDFQNVPGLQVQDWLHHVVNFHTSLGDHLQLGQRPSSP